LRICVLNAGIAIVMMIATHGHHDHELDQGEALRPGGHCRHPRVTPMEPFYAGPNVSGVAFTLRAQAAAPIGRWKGAARPAAVVVRAPLKYCQS
jgi:hypothetical protein